VLRTSVSAETLTSPEAVRSYKQLKEVERAFRSFKGPLEIRPIHHRLEDRVRAHVFLCMLAYDLEWHLRQAWAELTFKDECPPVSADPVAKAARSPEAERKARSKRTAAGQPCHSFRDLIGELARRTQNTVRIPGSDAAFTQLSEPNPLQTRALELARTADIA
jgi:Transposase DDE domain